ncbi:hypothetical protein DPMN_059732 [Dreissena polymorpha]|uniref:Uncharacterized protein n=1 Tax=Dreissena polymorpha TaxID=45954 RepID=A0A9D4C4D6_DREPO|nr:hypothetical protein DPMN_059732 [Dreissena polymorpha]
MVSLTVAHADALAILALTAVWSMWEFKPVGLSLVGEPSLSSIRSCSSNHSITARPSASELMEPQAG